MGTFIFSDPPYKNQTRKIRTITKNPAGKKEHMKKPGKPDSTVIIETLSCTSRLKQKIKIIRIISNRLGCNFKSFS
jgi:tryptophanyl-tRNA synthetase